MTKPKRKPVEAWAVVDHDGDLRTVTYFRVLAERYATAARFVDGKSVAYRVVRLVEHDPRAAALVKIGELALQEERALNWWVDESERLGMDPKSVGVHHARRRYQIAKRARETAVERMERKR